MHKKTLFKTILLFISLQTIAGAVGNNPIMFVTQFPISVDFATIGSTFGNHSGRITSAGRGGDLYIRYNDGTLRNLTREAGYGNSGLQANNAIAVRDPSIHWDGNKALFSMVIGAPGLFQHIDYFWQIYEITGFQQGQTISITKIASQASDYNNITPIYGSDGNIIFTSDMPRTKNRFNYPQYDEYESTPTNTGLWKLDLQTGITSLLQHSPSGSFSPMIDSEGRIVFTRWDHLQRDQQATPVSSTAFNYSSEAPDAIALDTDIEVFPEPRRDETDLLAGTNLEGHSINHFFPWEINQDGSKEETLNHVGRHELHTYFNRSMNDDDNLVEFINSNPTAVFNFFQLHEDPNIVGRFVGVDAPEFRTHAAGQIVAINLPRGARPDLVITEYITHKITQEVIADDETPPPEHIGFSRDPITLVNGTVLASHTFETRQADNDGTRANPSPRYDFRLKTYTSTAGHLQPDSNLTTLGNANIAYYDPDVLVSYNGPLWELQAVEVVARPQPPMTTESVLDPEQQIFAEENIDANYFKAFMQARNLAVVVMRDLTTRDVADKQQPFNLKVADSSHQTIGTTGLIYEIAYMQFLQGDQIRGYGGIDNPRDGQRVIAQFQHDTNAAAHNITFAGAPIASTEIYPDGSAAFFVPAQRAMAWQSLAPDSTPVVRERYWITFQPGEIRACGGCHGVNNLDQSGELPSIQKAEAFRALLQHWQQNFPDLIFSNGFES
ncbi:MAG: hypothetical protein L3J53_07185 [Proteobacteria bacterium]|nr:hypothetical protein [Pseudomonadota bacterium]